MGCWQQPGPGPTLGRSPSGDDVWAPCHHGGVGPRASEDPAGAPDHRRGVSLLLHASRSQRRAREEGGGAPGTWPCCKDRPTAWPAPRRAVLLASVHHGASAQPAGRPGFIPVNTRRPGAGHVVGNAGFTRDSRDLGRGVCCPCGTSLTCKSRPVGW